MSTKKTFQANPKSPEEVLPAAENGQDWMEEGLAADEEDIQAFLNWQAQAGGEAQGGGEAQVSLSLCPTSCREFH